MKSKLNISGIIGLLLALLLVIFVGIALDKNNNINLSQLISFWNLPSVAITVGGTIGGLIFMFPVSVLKNVPKMLGMVFKPKQYDPKKYIEDMVEYCKIARMKGILQLEESANQCEDPFMKSALMLIVDANDSEKVKSMLDDAIDFMCERHESNMLIWLKGSASAPAFGMIGTLVGLINMLAALNPNDPDSASNLGSGMSVALVTTFYGCIMTNIFFNPIANQLKYLHNREVLCMQIVEEGALAIIAGANPRYVQERLEMMLARSEVQGKGKGKKNESK
ncbi:MAG: MotA/TolQ/ExbB proton channel [Oscillospiraceae bacterium]|jgi:chemotaxis protein MotA|nr:MotA/TolQ/ExbB proton channel [Oscillospiraceae bacterium]